MLSKHLLNKWVKENEPEILKSLCLLSFCFITADVPRWYEMFLCATDSVHCFLLASA